MANSVSVYLGLGSNLGDRRENLKKALDLLGQRLRVEKESSVYDTEPQDNPDQPRFLNMAVHAYTTLEPHALLTLLKGIEAKLGRAKSAERYAPRIIDIDILYYDDIAINTPTLTIPHPRIPERAFFLVPLEEIAPDFKHPVSKKTPKQMLAELQKGVQGVFKFVEPCETGSIEPKEVEVKDVSDIG
jgi:2-amino-4-hydroxy-6-hydroxymethyldihydropteridine diphosphokinase